MDEPIDPANIMADPRHEALGRRFGGAACMLNTEEAVVQWYRRPLPRIVALDTDDEIEITWQTLKSVMLNQNGLFDLGDER